MKLFHLSDLHLGIRVCEHPLIEDQKHILTFILKKVREQNPDAVMIAGDVYDRAVPSEEAVKLFDDFLCGLVDTGTTVLITSGNHDSAERLSFGGKIMRRGNVYISPDFTKENYADIIKPVTLKDEFGEVNFYMLPFVTPGSVRKANGAEISDWSGAVDSVIKDMNVDTSARSVLIAHQFVTGAEKCDSETFSVGGADNVSAEVFSPFDYTALGHLHGKQSVSRETVRYCGSPLKYSFSEVNHQKSITVLELKEKGNVTISEIPLDEPLHDWRVVNVGELGKLGYEELSAMRSDDYVEAVLSDEDYVLDAMNRLREFFPNIMKMRYDNAQTRKADKLSKSSANLKGLAPLDVFDSFFKQQTGKELTEEQRALVKEIFESEEEI